MSIYKRKSGPYAVRFDLEPTTTGLRRRKSLGTYRTRKEAESAERKVLEARDSGIDLAPQAITVAQLMQRYLNDREALGRAPKALQEYHGYNDRHIVPHLGNIRLAKLKTVRIAEWLAYPSDKRKRPWATSVTQKCTQRFSVL